MTVKTQIAGAVLATSMLAFASAAHADITGSIDATITLESGCLINGNNTADNAANVDFGTLSFGTQTTLFSEASAQLGGTGTGITVQCTAGIAPTLVFKAGLHDAQATGSGNKAMQHSTTTTKYVSYTLLRADGSTVLNVDDGIPLADDGTEQTIVVNGRAFGAAGLIAGDYADTVTVVLEL